MNKLFPSMMAIILFLGIILVIPAVQASKKGQVILFTASWCAKCRTVNPIVQEVAGQNGLSVVMVDVDQQNAPQQVKRYGLDIPQKDLPQVYFVEDGTQQNILDGTTIFYGQDEKVRMTLMQNLKN